MGREVRRVPPTWEHPKDLGGRPRPLYDGSWVADVREWMDAAIAWDNGTEEDAPRQKADYPFYWEWSGGPPERDSYMPDWPEAERTHYQMYETTSEGTPISPVMASPEELARWLADHNASAFGSSTASYEAWLGACRGGWAPSAAMIGGQLISGVEAMQVTQADPEVEHG